MIRGVYRRAGGQHGRQVVNKLVSDNNKHITIIESMTGRCRFFLFFLQFFFLCSFALQYAVVDYLVGRLYFIHRSDIISLDNCCCSMYN